MGVKGLKTKSKLMLAFGEKEIGFPVKTNLILSNKKTTVKWLLCQLRKVDWFKSSKYFVLVYYFLN